jgi:hypothetical protein
VSLLLTIAEARTAYSVGVFLERTQIGGFSGYLYSPPIGMEPPEPKPQRLASTVDEEEESD